MERVETDGDRKRVRFAEPAGGSTTYQYFREAPACPRETNYYEFGRPRYGSATSGNR